MDLLRQGQGDQGVQVGQQVQAVHQIHLCQGDQWDQWGPVESRRTQCCYFKAVMLQPRSKPDFSKYAGK